jgi:exosortase
LQALHTRVPGFPALSASRFVLGLGIAALVLPTLYVLAKDYWSTDNGVHGPILLATGGWLIWRSRGVIRAHSAPIRSPWLLLGVVPLLLLYVYGRALGVPTVESGALYLLLLLVALSFWGPRVMRRLWFPALYLAFLVRPPATMVAEFTQPLKIWISQVSTALLHEFGYAIASSGVRIQIEQYEVLVQHACAGLGSIFSLLAVGLLYLHLVSRAKGALKLLLLAAIIPIAVVANLLRVILLLLLTAHFGEDVAQGLSHDAAGLLTFALSLLLLFALDHGMAALGRDRKGPSSAVNH